MAFNAKKELNQFGTIFPTAYITRILRVLNMRCLILKLQGPKLENSDCIIGKDQFYNNALQPNVVWGALCSYGAG